MGSWKNEARLAGLERFRSSALLLGARDESCPFWSRFPGTGPYRRELYPRHLEFFATGAVVRRRGLVAANRVGKTDGGCYEIACHMCGEYPEWWEGARFNRPVRCWACSTTAKQTRDILQSKLLGEIQHGQHGLLPGVLSTSAKYGLPRAIEIVTVRHKSGGISVCQFKSYDQGREAFQGTQQDVILLDEEPELEVYTECLLRTMATGDFPGGHLLLTFTPLYGLSETVLQYMPDGIVPDPQLPGQWVVQADWDDVPHLSAEEKAAMLAAIPPYQRDARSRGIPVLGAGVIYPVPEDDYLIDDMVIAPHWKRVYAEDVGWNCTAALWGAYDADNDIVYLYSEYWRGEAEPSIHASAIRARGEWIEGVIDPGANGRSEVDGKRLIEMYSGLGLHLSPAKNAVEAGLYTVWERLSTGRLKVFRSLQKFQKEI